MKGLDRYIKKHGKHFTEKLASDVTLRKWDSSKIQKAAQKRVYYNVTGSTSGDMMYLMDMFHQTNKMLLWVGDYKKTSSPFCIWLAAKITREEDFDFTPYI